MNGCKPFEHDLGYVTDREDYVECKKCFIQWKMGFDGERAKARKDTIRLTKPEAQLIEDSFTRFLNVIASNPDPEIRKKYLNTLHKIEKKLKKVLI